MNEGPPKGATLVGLGTVRKDGARVFEMPLPQSWSNDRVHRSFLVTLAWFSPVDISRARYRLAQLEAVAADDGDEPDQGWRLKMKGDVPSSNAIAKGTVWSRRLKHARVLAPAFGADAIIPIRVQCSDLSGGGLSHSRRHPFRHCGYAPIGRRHPLRHSNRDQEPLENPTNPIALGIIGQSKRWPTRFVG